MKAVMHVPQLIYDRAWYVRHFATLPAEFTHYIVLRWASIGRYSLYGTRGADVAADIPQKSMSETKMRMLQDICLAISINTVHNISVTGSRIYRQTNNNNNNNNDDDDKAMSADALLRVLVTTVRVSFFVSTSFSYLSCSRTLILSCCITILLLSRPTSRTDDHSRSIFFYTL